MHIIVETRKKITLQLSVLIKLSNESSFALQKGTINMTLPTTNSVSSNIVFVFNKEIGKVIDIPYCSYSDSKAFIG